MNVTLPQDLLLYSAKVIPGNEGKVTKMLNALAGQGARVRQSRADNLHTSGERAGRRAGMQV